MIWTENKYIFKIYGSYYNEKGKAYSFKYTEPLYLYFDLCADEDGKYAQTSKLPASPKRSFEL